MQYQPSIVTKFHGPTNYLGARVSARLSDRGIFKDRDVDKIHYVSWRYELNSEENHKLAAEKCLATWNDYYKREYDLSESTLTDIYTCSADGAGYVFLFSK